MFAGALLGFFFPAIGQALIGRWRAGLLICGGAFAVSLLAALWAPLIWSAGLLVLGSSVHAALAVRRGARPSRSHVGAAILVAALHVGALVLGRRLVSEAFKIPSTSMAPTLLVGDHIASDKLSLAWSPPRRGEVIAFHYPADPERAYVSRVVAIAGDEIAVVDHAPVVNGVTAPRRLIGPNVLLDGDTPLEVTEYEEVIGDVHHRLFYKATGGDVPADVPCPREAPVPLALNAARTACVVPAGTVFVLGDDRWNSNDSRRWGALPVRMIFARVSGIWLPGAGAGGREWSRLGRLPR